MTQINADYRTANRLAVRAFLVLSIAAMLTATVTDAEANVLVYTSGLTTSLSTSTGASNGSDVFFNFLTGTSNKSSAAAYQYRLNTSNANISIDAQIQGDANSAIDNDNNFNARRYATGEIVTQSMQYTGLGFLASNETGNSGSFLPGQSGYLGLRFTNSNNIFFGWADITLNNDYTVTLNRFAYEDEVGAPIRAGVVPEANPLELLLLGAVGMGAYRLTQKTKVAA